MGISPLHMFQDILMFLVFMPKDLNKIAEIILLNFMRYPEA